MLTSHTIGEISLSFSSIVYFIWLLPQVFLNYRRKSTVGLSFWLHVLLFLGYTADLVYGFGLHMQWQYRAVTIVGLCSLILQHIQFGCYRNAGFVHRHYYGASVVLFSAFSLALYFVCFKHYSQLTYDNFGMLSNLCFLVYMVPQVFCNYQNHSASGLSFIFVLLSVLLGFCDLTSAYALGWDWPSVAGPLMSLSIKLILIAQIYYYGYIYGRQRCA